ncbi:MAG: SulP family inorganic anion transporter [Sphingomonadaceae bacterium]
MRDYSPALLLSDALAGLTVALVALPLSIAIAIASGADPAKGLVTAIIGGLLISLLGGSRVQIGGPTGAFIVVVFGVVADHGYDGLVLATLMAGVILIVAGWLRVGKLIAFVPEAVVNGFTIGIAIIIGFSQLGDLLGLDLRGVSAEITEKASAIWAARREINPAALTTGVAAMVLIVAMRRAFPRFPGLVVAMAVASAMVALAALPVETIAGRYGELPRTLPWPAIPQITLPRVIELLPSALVIAFLAAVESLLSAMVADRMIGSQHRPNAEVSAQGWANVGSALFGGMPATGAIARTATNVNAGGKTPMAGVLHAVFILLIMLIAAPVAGYLVLPALAGLLLITAWNMSEPHKWRSYWAEPVENRVLLILTLVLTVVADLTIAIGTGVALGLLLRLKNSGIKLPEWNGPER